MKNRYQNVFIELSDGSKGVFTGAVLLEPPQPDVEMPSVSNIQFTEPIEPDEEEAEELQGLLKDLEGVVHDLTDSDDDEEEINEEDNDEEE